MKPKNSSPVQAIDLFGGKFNLRFSSKTGTFQTKLGGYLTVLLGTASIVIMVNIMYQYFDTESPIVTTSTELNESNYLFNLYEQDLYLLIAFSNAYGFIEDYKRFITLKLRVYDMIYDSTRKSYNLQKIKEFDYVNCDKISDRKILNILNLTHSNKDIHELSLCPDFVGSENEFSISDDLETNIYRRAEVTFYPCSLEDRTKCAKPEEFTHFRAYYGRMHKLLTSANFENPVTLSPTIGDINLNPQFSKFMKFAVHNNRVIDSKYEFFAPKIKKEYSSFEIIERDINPRIQSHLHCTKKQIDLWKRGGCDEYLSIVYEVKREVFIVMRNYKRISDAFGQFGGIMKLLTTAVFFLYSWYNRAQIRSSIIAATFGFTQDDQKEVENFIEFIQKNDKEEKTKMNGKSFKNDPNAQDQDYHGQKFNKNKDLNERRRNQLRPKNNHQDAKNQARRTPGSDQGQKLTEAFKFEKIISQLARQRTNVEDLINKLNFLDFLQKIFLDKNLKKLLPMFLLKAECEKQHHQGQENTGGENFRGDGGAHFNSLQKGGEKHAEPQIQILDESNQEQELETSEVDNQGILHGLNQRRQQVIIKSGKNANLTQPAILWQKTRGVPLERRDRNIAEPNSLKSAFCAIKASSQSESCPLKACIKKYVIREIGEFFEEKNLELNRPENPDLAQSSYRIILHPISDQREPNISQRMQHKEGVNCLNPSVSVKQKELLNWLNPVGPNTKNSTKRSNRRLGSRSHRRLGGKSNRRLGSRLPAKKNKNFNLFFENKKKADVTADLEPSKSQDESKQNFLD